MRIHLLGTAAAEGWPGVFCTCEACVKARAQGGKSIRTRSGALVDDVFKFDWPSDTYMQALRDGVDLSRVRHLIFTHTHHDHYYPAEMIFRVPPFAHGAGRLDIWGDHWAIEGIRQEVDNRADADDALHVVEAGTSYELDDARIIPLKAKHFPERGCFNYIFSRGGKTLLYGQDSGWFPDAHWEAQRGHRFDVVVLDCTGGPRSAGEHHGDVDMVIRTKERMVEMGTADEETIFVANHFSHNGGALHDELEALFSPHGILVSYDGMVIEV